MNVYITIILIVAIWFLIAEIGKAMERHDFNGGVCPDCGEKLEYFDSDSQGGRGYVCRKCGHSAWVSYNSVDREYWEREKEKN